MMKKSLAAAVGAMLMAGSAAAVEVSHGGKGDLLIAPLFMTGGGWRTELKVINTNTVDSAVAKVVFHAPGRSEEVLDFLIFLSPGDVWVGTIQQNADGSVGVSSTDPSSITVALQANGCPSATGTSGFDPTQARFTIPVTTGYVNIFETRMIRGLGNAPVAKSAILSAYAAACTAQTLITAADTDNVLVGVTRLFNPTNGNNMSLGMTTLKDYNNTTYHSVGALTGFFNNGALTTKQQVEDALWGSNYVIPYNNAAGQFAFGVVTFPTKETFAASLNSQYAPFFPVVNDAVNDVGTAVPVTYSVRDEEENVLGTVGCVFSPCAPASIVSLPREVNVVAIATGGSIAGSTATQVNTQTFTKGWMNVAITTDVSDTRSVANYNNFGAAGSPAIVTYINWDTTMGNLQGTWQYAPRTYNPAAN